MPKTSHRSQTVPLSPFRKLAALAEQAKARGTHVYHLNIGQPDIHTPPAAIAKLQQLDVPILEYGPAEGLATTRAAVSRYYQRAGIDIAPEQVMITTGASEAIQLALYTCFESGEEVIIPEPFYANYNGFAQIAGVQVRPVTSTIETGFALPSLEAFERQITSKTRGILICNPSNPTGTFYSREVLEGLAGLARQYDLYLIVDEVYSDFCYEGQPFCSVLQLEGLEQHAIAIDSVSKRFSACGARIGTLVTRNEGVRANVKRYAMLRLSPPVLEQHLTEYLLDDEPASYLEAVRTEYNSRRELLYRRLTAIPGVLTYKPGGAFYCFARFPIDDAERFCEWLLEAFQYKGSTVMLSAGASFYATPGLGKDEVRIAYILNTKDLDAAMDCLEQALSVYPGRVEAFSGVHAAEAISRS